MDSEFKSLAMRTNEAICADNDPAIGVPVQCVNTELKAHGNGNSCGFFEEFCPLLRQRWQAFQVVRVHKQLHRLPSIRCMVHLLQQPLCIGVNLAMAAGGWWVGNRERPPPIPPPPHLDTARRGGAVDCTKAPCGQKF